MFRGYYEHQLDDKNRLRIPSKFKKELVGENKDKTYSFMLGKHNCICVFEDETLDEYLSDISDEKLSEASAESAMVFSHIFSAEEDQQGRVVLPSLLKKLAGIKKNIITLGRGNRLEIWDPERYEEFISGIDYDKALEKLKI